MHGMKWYHPFTSTFKINFHTQYQKVIFKCEENDLFVAVDSTCKMQQTDMVKKFNWFQGQFFCNLLIVD